MAIPNISSNKVKKFTEKKGLLVKGRALTFAKKTVSNFRGHFIWPKNNIDGEEITIDHLNYIHLKSRHLRGNFDVFSIFRNRGIPYISDYLPFHTTVLKSNKSFNMVNESIFMKNFDSMYVGIKDILQSMNVSVPCVAACGGSVSKCLINQPSDSSDVDLFIFGVHSWDFREKEGELLSHFKEGMSKLRVLSTIIEFEWNNIKIQIIRRCYDTMQSIIHGFDISACSVAFDGREVFMTHRALFAYQHRMVVIDPELDRSRTYERRLEKYLSRGFSIVLPRCYIRGTGIISLPKMDINVIENKYDPNRGVTFLKLGKQAIVPKGNCIYDDYEEYTGRRLNNIEKIIKKYKSNDLSYIVKGEITTSLLANNIFLQKLFNGSDLDVYDFLDIHIEKQTLSMLDYLPYDITEIILKKCGDYERISLAIAFKNLDFLPEDFNYFKVNQLIVDQPWKQFTGSMKPDLVTLAAYLGDFYKP